MLPEFAKYSDDPKRPIVLVAGPLTCVYIGNAVSVDLKEHARRMLLDAKAELMLRLRMSAFSCWWTLSASGVRGSRLMATSSESAEIDLWR